MKEKNENEKAAMKIAAKMSAVIAALMALVILSATSAKGAISNAPVVLVCGSTNALLQRSATNTQGMACGIGANGAWSDAQLSHNVSFANVAAVNSAFQGLLQFDAGLALSNAAIDKTQPVFVNAYAYNDNYPPPFGVWFPSGTAYPEPSFSFVKSNGVWVVPDISWINLILPDQITYYIPTMEYCRIEVYSNGMTTPFQVADSRFNPTEFYDVQIDTTNQSFTADTVYMASGHTGPYQLKITMLTSSGFIIADGNGLQVAEKPISIQNFSVQNGLFSLNVVGGDVGRVFMIQHNPDLMNWVTVGGPYTVNGSPIAFQEAVVNSSTSKPPLAIRNFALNPISRVTSFDVVWGKTNTVFQIMESTDLKRWVNVSTPQYRVDTNPMPFLEPIGSATSSTAGFFKTAIMPQMFYRIVTTNAVPQ